jgi:hypothetical protein
MATPNTTFVSGAILTATQQNNLAWGQVGTATKSTDQNVTTKADLAGLSVTFTAVANRVYEVSVTQNIFANVGVSNADLFVTDGTTDFAESLGTIPLNHYETRTIVTAITGLTAGTKTIKVQAQATASTVFYGTGIRASIAGRMIIKDIGAA